MFSLVTSMGDARQRFAVFVDQTASSLFEQRTGECLKRVFGKFVILDRIGDSSEHSALVLFSKLVETLDDRRRFETRNTDIHKMRIETAGSGGIACRARFRSMFVTHSDGFCKTVFDALQFH